MQALSIHLRATIIRSSRWTELWAKLTNDLRLTFEPAFSAIKLSASDDNRHNQFALNVGVSMLMRSREIP